MTEKTLNETLAAIRRSRAVAALSEIQRRSVERGTDAITPAEIDAEIAAVRRGDRAVGLKRRGELASLDREEGRCRPQEADMSLVLEFPDSIEAALRFPPGQQVDELFKELAVALYARNALSFSKACALSM